jgi:P pilus assembly chaperone PapD
MKKIFVILVAVIGFGFSMSAGPSCKIQGTDNGTVEAYIVSSDGTQVEVSFSNDSDKYVNVRFVIGKGQTNECREMSVMVPPQQSITKKYTCSYKGSVIDVTGARCQ